MLSLLNKPSLLHDGVYWGEKVTSASDLSSRRSRLTSGGRVGVVPSLLFLGGMPHGAPAHTCYGTAGLVTSPRPDRRPSDLDARYMSLGGFARAPAQTLSRRSIEEGGTWGCGGRGEASSGPTFRKNRARSAACVRNRSDTMPMTVRLALRLHENILRRGQRPADVQRVTLSRAANRARGQKSQRVPRNSLLRVSRPNRKPCVLAPC